MLSRPVRLGRALAAGALTLSVALTACGSSAASGSKADLCKKLKDDTSNKLSDQLSKAKTVQDLKSGVSKLNDKIQELPGAAPTDISKDVKTVADSYQKIKDETDKSTSVADFQKRVSATTGNMKDAQAASTRVDTWKKKNCG